MGVINFGWLAVWVPSPDRFCRIAVLCDRSAPGGAECGTCPDFASNALQFPLQLRKMTENLIQGNRMPLNCSAPNAIRLVGLAIAGDGLDLSGVV